MEIVGRSHWVGKARTRRFKTVAFPWDPGKGIRIRSLFDKEQSQYDAETLSENGGLYVDRLISAKRRYLVLTLVDKDGNPYLTAADVAEMEEHDGREVAFAFNQALDHCGHKESDIEALVKNSGAVKGSASPDSSDSTAE